MHLDLSHMSGVPRSPGFIHTSKTERLDYPNAPDLLSWSQPLPLPKAATTKANRRLAKCPLPVPIRAWLTAIVKQGAWLLWFILQTHSEGLLFSRHSAIFEVSFNLPGSSSHFSYMAGVFDKPAAKGSQVGKVPGWYPKGHSLEHQTSLSTDGDLSILQPQAGRRARPPDVRSQQRRKHHLPGGQMHSEGASRTVRSLATPSNF